MNNNNADVYSVIVENFSVQDLRSLNDFIRNKYKNGIIIMLSKNVENKIAVAVSVSSDLQNSYNAGQIIKVGLNALSGKGGGNAAFAQGAGTGNPEESLKKMNEVI